MAYYVVAAILGLMIITSSYASDYSFGELGLPKIFSDHMVIQRDQPIRVYGSAAPFERVEVKLKDTIGRGQADFSGRWTITLAAMPTGGPYELVVQGKHKIVVKDILLGDVWVCTGQSNMQRTVADSDFTPANAECANASKLRHFIRETPLLTSTDVPEVWRIANEQNVGNFSAVAYAFSNEVQAKSGVPIGIIECPVGGTPIKTWISRATIGKKGSIPGLSAWKYSYFFDGIILPLSRNHIKGVIWYQGESDVFGANEYPKLLRMLIRDLRSAFGEPMMPFIYVQLPNFGRRLNAPSDSFWADLREAQQKCALASNVGMTVNIDTAHNNGAAEADLHPTTKIEVGHRLAKVALTKYYGVKGHCLSPSYQSMRHEGSAIRIHFRAAEDGLVCHGDTVKGFALAGADQKFRWAQAEILPDRNDVRVWNPEIPHPVAVRYAWADNPECNLYSAEGLPAAPFRSDSWRSSLTSPKKK
jgi:sialate O-acetylesterase